MALITSIASGNWSDPTIWNLGTVPTTGDDVIIDTGHTITIDTDIGSIGSDTGSNDAIRVEGELRWNGDVNCTATLFGNLHQLAGGIINFNGTADRTKVLTLYMNASSSPSKYKYNFIIENASNIYIEGYSTVNDVWYPINEVVAGTTNTITTKDIALTDWQVGDSVILATNIYNVGDNSFPLSKYTITAISGNTITLDQNVEINCVDNSAVANITRNIQFLNYQNDTTLNRILLPNGTSDNNPLVFKWCYFENIYRNNPDMEKDGTLPMYNFYILVGSVFIGLPYQRREMYLSSIQYPCCNKSIFISHNILDLFAVNWRNGTVTNPFIQDSLFYGNRSYSRLRAYQEQEIINCFISNKEIKLDDQQKKRTFINCILFSDLLGTTSTNSSPTKFDLYNCYISSKNNININLTSVEKIYNCIFDTNQTININMKNAEYQKIEFYKRTNPNNKINVNVKDLISNCYVYTDNNLHDYYNYYCHTYNQTTVKYGQNEAVEIQSLNAGEFSLSTRILVDPDTSYKFDLYLMKDSLTATPPKVQLWKGTQLLDEKQMTDTVNNWEKLSVSWYSNFKGFIEIRFVFTSDTGTEKFWISDTRDSFSYWSEGYIIPVYPRNEVTPDTVAKAVWEYAVRTLTAGTRDNEIDDIKAKTDKMTFDSSNNIKSIAQNSELSNLDEKISTRKAANQIDFTDSDRTHLLSLQNYDDTQVKQLLNELLDIEEGNWEIKNNQMIFYRRDGSELMRFNLKDKNNQPSEKDVFKRERV